MHKNLFNIFYRAFGLVGATLVVGALALSVPIAQAALLTDRPDWNTGGTANENTWFLVSNATKGTGWATSVPVSAGDLLTFQVYVHNNTCAANDATGNNMDQCPATAARHAFVKVTLPATGGTVTATIGSDQASSNVSQNLTLTLPSGQTVTYKNGTTILRRHPFQDAWVDVTKTQDFLGADDITTTGLALGDVPGCYSQAVVVIFQATVSNGSVKGISNLPNTGPEQGVQLFLLGMIPAGVLLRRVRI